MTPAMVPLLLPHARELSPRMPIQKSLATWDGTGSPGAGPKAPVIRLAPLKASAVPAASAWDMPIAKPPPCPLVVWL